MKFLFVGKFEEPGGDFVRLVLEMNIDSELSQSTGGEFAVLENAIINDPQSFADLMKSYVEDKFPVVVGSTMTECTLQHETHVLDLQIPSP